MDDDSSGSDMEEVPVSVAEGGGLTLVTLSENSYISKNTGVKNANIVVDPSRSKENRQFVQAAHNFLGAIR